MHQKNSRKRYLFFFIIVLFLIVTACNLKAVEDQSAKIGAVRGDVTAIGVNGVVRDLNGNDGLGLDEYVVTGKGGLVELVFADNTIVTLGESSTVRLDQYFWEIEKQQGRFEVAISEGVFRIQGGKITKSSPEYFKIWTPAATIGTKGASFGGMFREKKLRVYLEEGKGVDVYNEFGSTALIIPGEGTAVVIGEGAPQRSRIIAVELIERLILEPTTIGSNDLDSGSILTSGESKIVEGVNVVNSVTITDSTNTVSGQGNTAVLGRVAVQNSTIKGRVINEGVIEDSTNTSSGEDNTVILGGVAVQDSTIEGTVGNEVEINDSGNTSSGEDNTVILGGVAVQDSTIEGTVENEVEINDSGNTSSGEDNTVILGGVAVQDSTIEGIVGNEAVINDSDNIASGESNTVVLGGVGILTSAVDNRIVNDASIRNSANISSGSENITVMGGVVIHNSTVDGTVENDTEIEDSVNISSGAGNSAVMGGILIE